MKYFTKQIMVLFIILSLSAGAFFNQKICFANDYTPPEAASEAAVLIEAETGKILYEKNKDKEMIPASITKIMTLLLIFESIDSGKISLSDQVTVSEYAASMGGSQVFLEAGEVQDVNTMIKCISIASANDACVAMAEHMAGNETAFVELMNEKAKELGMEHTHFLNCNGLDDSISEGHYSSAYDVALMSRELITKHPEISDYSTVWMDTITHTNHKGQKSEFGLTNTNKLVRTYQGITGLKTGSTAKAKYCLSASAKRDGIDLIAVVMAAPDHKKRFSIASSLLDYGFSITNKYSDDCSDINLPEIKLKGSISESINTEISEKFNYIFTKGEDTSLIKRTVKIPEYVNAPINKGDVIGNIEYSYGGQIIGKIDIISKTSANKATFTDYFKALVIKYFTFL